MSGTLPSLTLANDGGAHLMSPWGDFLQGHRNEVACVRDSLYQHKRLTFVVPGREYFRRRRFAPSLGQSSPAGLVFGVKGDRFLGAWSKVNYFGW